MFRRKPAITSLDWHFTAFQNSSENIATFTRSIHYNLVLERSTGFGSNRSNLSNTNIWILHSRRQILFGFILDKNKKGKGKSLKIKQRKEEIIDLFYFSTRARGPEKINKELFYLN